jgi:hypothetical protein
LGECSCIQIGTIISIYFFKFSFVFGNNRSAGLPENLENINTKLRMLSNGPELKSIDDVFGDFIIFGGQNLK